MPEIRVYRRRKPHEMIAERLPDGRWRVTFENGRTIDINETILEAYARVDGYDLYSTTEGAPKPPEDLMIREFPK